jgi:anti-sigma factor RsiW
MQEHAVLSCAEVIARHSEYVDGELPPLETEKWRAHLATCTICARYDRVLRKGVQLLHDTDLQADPEFIQHLRYRIADEDHRMTMRPIGMNAGAVASVAAVVALAAWLPVAVMKSQESPAATSPSVSTAANEIAWHRDEAVTLIHGAYSPLVVEPPTAPPSYTRARLTSLHTR